MIDLTQDQLGQCVTYFVQGSPMQIVGGVATAIALLIPVLTRWNVPDAVRGVFAPMMKKPTEKTVTVNNVIETVEKKEEKTDVESP
jgi:hypothetical protein